MILINHPLDCPICDQGGECKLQDVSMGYGGCDSNYQEEKRVVVNKNLGPLIATDMTRCIHCTRCVRFGEEIGGMMELGMGNRGEHSEIMSFMQSTVDSEISGNAIDLCPVGALTSKPFRFSARGWELTNHASVSPHDSWGSRLRVQTRSDQVFRVLPDTADEINECWISDRDRFSYTAINSETRLTSPMVFEKSPAGIGRWREISWDEAKKAIVTAHRHIPANRTQILASAGATVEELAMLAKLQELAGIKVATGLRRAHGAAITRTFGGRIRDLAHAKNTVLIGSFLRSEQPLYAARLRRAVRAGAKVHRLHISAESLNMPLASDITLLPHELPIALALLVNTLSQSLATPLPEDVQNLVAEIGTKLPADKVANINMLCALLAKREGETRLMLGHYAENSVFAPILSVLTESITNLINRSGATASWGYLVAGANAVGAMAVGVDIALSTLPIQEAEALWLYRAEPCDTAYTAALQSSLKGAKAIVHFTSFLPKVPLTHETVHSANPPLQMVLPLATFAEQDGTMINGEGRVQSFSAAVSPTGQAKPGWKVLRVLAETLSEIGERGYENLSSAFHRYNVSADIRTDALSRSAIGHLSRCGNWLIDINTKLTDSVMATAKETVRLITGEAMPNKPYTYQRIAYVGQYFGDELMRHSLALQHTRLARIEARLNPADINALKSSGSGHCDCKLASMLSTSDSAIHLECPLVADSSVMIGTISLSSGHPNIAFDDSAKITVTLSQNACAEEKKVGAVA